MKPVIGVLLRYQHLEDGRAIVYMSEILRRCIIQAGGIVYSISPVQDVSYIDTKGNEFAELTDSEKEVIDYNLKLCDGFILPGGIKFTPYDRYVLERIIELKKPVLGICLGMQMMSCLNEKIELIRNETEINHFQESDLEFTHKVKINKDSKLYKILGKEEFIVNSFHNYHISENSIYKTVGYSEDGLIEAIEYPSEVFNVGIQWHPEISYLFDDNSKKIIDYFIKEACLEKVEI